MIVEVYIGKPEPIYADNKVAWLTNGRVAWQIPDKGGIALNYNAGVYRPPKGWYIRNRLPRRYRFTGECGERRVAPA